jgi:hypothetical protein
MARVDPDPKFVSMAEEILTQNRSILDMNAKLLEALCRPPQIWMDVDTRVEVKEPHA